jgi:hypothetical protein
MCRKGLWQYQTTRVPIHHGEDSRCLQILELLFCSSEEQRRDGQDHCLEGA